jgi:hypothetical protein
MTVTRMKRTICCGPVAYGILMDIRHSHISTDTIRDTNSAHPVEPQADPRVLKRRHLIRKEVVINVDFTPR